MENIVPEEILGENMELKQSNRMYRNIFIGIVVIAVAVVAYWIGTLRSPKTVEVPSQLDSIDTPYIPTTPPTNTVPFNTLPGDSNPQGSDTAPPGGVTVD